MDYKQKLINILANFDLNKAIQLSDEIHRAESNGYNLNNLEGLLWEDLSNKIEINK